MLILLLSAFLARGTPEMDLVPPPVNRTMTGDWGDSREFLREHGLTINPSFTTDLVGNPVGGMNQGFSYAGSFGLNVGLDFEKAWNITGLDLFTSVVWRTGTSLSREHIGNQFPVQQLFGSQTIKLNELFLRETLAKGAFVLKAGRLNAGNDFLQNELYYRYVSNAFDGNPISVFFNTQFTAYPSATWGAFLSFKPIRWLQAKFAVYNTNSNINKNKYHGLNFTFKSTNGAIWITEWDLLINENKLYPGNYKFGFFKQSGAVNQFNKGMVRGNPCLYFLFDQTVYHPSQDPKRKVTPFISLVFQPDNRNQIPFFTTSGIVYQGPFASRPKDAAVLGVAYGKYSSYLNQSAETVLELNYWIQMNEWCTFVPDLQYIINLKGEGKIPNALVLGAQIGIIL